MFDHRVVHYTTREKAIVLPPPVTRVPTLCDSSILENHVFPREVGAAL